MRDVLITTVPADGGDNLKDGVLPSAQRSVLYRGRSDIAGAALQPHTGRVDPLKGRR